MMVVFVASIVRPANTRRSCLRFPGADPESSNSMPIDPGVGRVLCSTRERGRGQSSSAATKPACGFATVSEEG
jgi:hypothetical protein